jgi:ATP-dependent DNA helicase
LQPECAIPYTPHQNNLAELWSLLNFILPDIFNDIDAFQQWSVLKKVPDYSLTPSFARFNLPTMQQNLSSSHSSQIIHSIHAILKPFLLRRLKADVEVNLPPKKEYVLYAPLSERQRELYDRTLEGSLREFLIGKDQQSRNEDERIDADAPRKLRSEAGSKRKKSYANLDDEESFDQLRPRQDHQMMAEELTNIAEIGREHHCKAIGEQRAIETLRKSSPPASETSQQYETTERYHAIA